MDIDQFHALLMKSFGDRLSANPEKVISNLEKASRDLSDLAQKLRDMDKSGFKSLNSVGDRVFVNVVRADNPSVN